MIGGLWRRWVALATAPTDTRPLAALRILVPLVVLADIARSFQVGMAPYLWHDFRAGGLSGFKGPDVVVLDLFGPEGGMIALATTVVCMVLVALGVGTRPAAVLGVLAYAQMGALYPTGDRAVDRILRLVLLLLVFSQAHRRWSLQEWLRRRRPVLVSAAWHSGLIRLVLVLVYLSAGVNKIGNGGWFGVGEPPVLYRIMTDPLAAELHHLDWAHLGWMFHIGALGTMALELTPMLLFTRYAPHWAVLGAALHLGIAATMGLGMFSWGMLALYPLLFAPWWLPALDRLRARRRPDPRPAR